MIIKILSNLVFFTLVLSSLSFSQTNIAVNDSPYLTKDEAKLLDSLLIKNSKDFSFKNKKAGFISGISAASIEKKSTFFNYHILDYLEKGVKPIITYRILNKSQKETSGGYEVLIMQTPKILRNKQLEDNLIKLSKTE